MKHYKTFPLGNDCNVKISTDDYLDSKVEINDKTVCWISWQDSLNFIGELNDTINKYRI